MTAHLSVGRGLRPGAQLSRTSTGDTSLRAATQQSWVLPGTFLFAQSLSTGWPRWGWRLLLQLSSLAAPPVPLAKGDVTSADMIAIAVLGGVSFQIAPQPRPDGPPAYSAGCPYRTKSTCSTNSPKADAGDDRRGGRNAFRRQRQLASGFTSRLVLFLKLGVHRCVVLVRRSAALCRHIRTLSRHHDRPRHLGGYVRSLTVPHQQQHTRGVPSTSSTGPTGPSNLPAVLMFTSVAVGGFPGSSAASPAVASWRGVCQLAGTTATIPGRRVGPRRRLGQRSRAQSSLTRPPFGGREFKVQLLPPHHPGCFFRFVLY